MAQPIHASIGQPCNTTSRGQTAMFTLEPSLVMSGRVIPHLGAKLTIGPRLVADDPAVAQCLETPIGG